MKKKKRRWDSAHHEIEVQGGLYWKKIKEIVG